MSDDNAKLYVLRLWDYYDGWIDITGPLSYDEVQKRWNESTHNGTIKAKEDFYKGYYSIFPANTRMIYNSEWMDR